MGTNDLVDGPGFASNENEKVENERRKKLFTIYPHERYQTSKMFVIYLEKLS